MFPSEKKGRKTSEKSDGKSDSKSFISSDTFSRFVAAYCQKKKN